LPHGKFVLRPSSYFGVADRVSAHPQVVEGQADVAVQVGHFLAAWRAQRGDVIRIIGARFATRMEGKIFLAFASIAP
jgi:hypothetical protein